MFCRFEGKLRSSEEGADTIIWLALQPKEKLVGGAFYFDRGEAPKHLPLTGTKNSHSAIDSIIEKLRSFAGLWTVNILPLKESLMLKFVLWSLKIDCTNRESNPGLYFRHLLTHLILSFPPSKLRKKLCQIIMVKVYLNQNYNERYI